MHVTHARGLAPAPGRAELEAMCVGTAQRLRALTRAAFGGHGYDPDAYDTALLVHRAARACATAARRTQDGPQTPAV